MRSLISIAVCTIITTILIATTTTAQQINLRNVLDVLTNPGNTIIGTASERLADAARQATNTLQEAAAALNQPDVVNALQSSMNSASQSVSRVSKFISDVRSQLNVRRLQQTQTETFSAGGPDVSDIINRLFPESGSIIPPVINFRDIQSRLTSTGVIPSLLSSDGPLDFSAVSFLGGGNGPDSPAGSGGNNGFLGSLMPNGDMLNSMMTNDGLLTPNGDLFRMLSQGGLANLMPSSLAGIGQGGADMVGNLLNGNLASAMMPGNLLNGETADFISRFSPLGGVLGSLTGSLNWPITLPLSPLDGSRVPAVGDVLNDVNLISSAARMMGKTSSTMAAMASTSLDMMPQMFSRNLSEQQQARSLLNSVGVFGLDGILKSVQAGVIPPSSPSSSNEFDSAPLLSTNTFLDNISGAARALGAQADALTMTLSNGVTNPLATAAETLRDAVTALTANPSDIITWAVFGAAIDNMKDIASRAPLAWTLTPEQSTVIEAVESDASSLLTMIGDIPGGPLTGEFTAALGNTLGNMSSSLSSLNNTTLIPRVDLSTVPDVIAKLNPFQLETDIVQNAFGFTAEVMEKMVGSSIDLSKLPTPAINIDVLPEMLEKAQAAIFPVMKQQADQVVMFMETLKASFEESLELVTAAAAPDATPNPLGMLKSLQLDAALNAARELSRSISGAMTDAAARIVPDIPSLLRPVPAAASSSSVPTRRLEGPDLLSEASHLSAVSTLLDVARALQTQFAAIDVMPLIACNDQMKQTGIDVIRAEALIGDPSEVLSAVGVTDEAVRAILTAATPLTQQQQQLPVGDMASSSSSLAEAMDPEASADINACIVKRNVLAGLKQWSAQMEEVGASLSSLAMTDNLTEVLNLEANIQKLLGATARTA